MLDITELLDDPVIGFGGALIAMRDHMRASFARMNEGRVRRGLLPIDPRTNKPVVPIDVDDLGLTLVERIAPGRIGA